MCMELCSFLAMRAFLARVYGRVQRVGYRRFVLDSAQELGVSGYVKNERDGSVTVFAQGEDAVIEKFIETIKSPPPPAQVRTIDIREAKPRPGLRYFAIKPSSLHEELQEGFGAMQTIFTDYWGEFRDYREEFREFARRMDENFKAIMEKYGEISEKLTTILETLTRESRETREMLNETMRLLREAIEKISR